MRLHLHHLLYHNHQILLGCHPALLIGFVKILDVGQPHSSSFSYMIPDSLRVHHPGGERPTRDTQVRLSVDLPVEPVEGHLGDAVSERSLLRLVSHGGAQVEDATLGQAECREESLAALSAEARDILCLFLVIMSTFSTALANRDSSSLSWPSLPSLLCTAWTVLTNAKV